MELRECAIRNVLFCESLSNLCVILLLVARHIIVDCDEGTGTLITTVAIVLRYLLHYLRSLWNTWLGNK